MTQVPELNGKEYEIDNILAKYLRDAKYYSKRKQVSPQLFCDFDVLIYSTCMYV